MGGKIRLGLVADSDVKKWYCDDLLTMQEIADRVGCKKQAVMHRLNKMGVAYRGGPVPRKCKHCGETFSANRKRLKNGKSLYCSIYCYQSDVSVSGKLSHAGQRAGRRVANAREGEVVHHINGDNFDNRPENLIVFGSHAQHAGFHKSGGARWLMDMVSDGKIVLNGITKWPK